MEPISRTVVALTIDEARLLVDWADRALGDHLAAGGCDAPDELIALICRLQRDMPEAKP